MYACLCHAVTVDEVERAVASGARTVEAIGEATCAGTGCGCCHKRLTGIIARVEGAEPAAVEPQVLPMPVVPARPAWRLSPNVRTA